MSAAWIVVLMLYVLGVVFLASNLAQVEETGWSLCVALAWPLFALCQVAWLASRPVANALWRRQHRAWCASLLSPSDTGPVPETSVLQGGLRPSVASRGGINE